MVPATKRSTAHLSISEIRPPAAGMPANAPPLLPATKRSTAPPAAPLATGDHALFRTGSGGRDGSWQLSETLRGFGRAEILGFLIPGSCHCHIGWRIGPYR
jgi:hypothetical protein